MKSIHVPFLAFATLSAACASSAESRRAAASPVTSPVTLTSGSPECKERNAGCTVDAECCAGECDYEERICH